MHSLSKISLKFCENTKQFEHVQSIFMHIEENFEEFTAVQKIWKQEKTKLISWAIFFTVSFCSERSWTSRNIVKLAQKLSFHRKANLLYQKL